MKKTVNPTNLLQHTTRANVKKMIYCYYNQYALKLRENCIELECFIQFSYKIDEYINKFYTYFSEDFCNEYKLLEQTQSLNLFLC